MLALIGTVYNPLHVLFFHKCDAIADFSVSIFNILKVFFKPSFQVFFLFCLSYINLLAILAIDLINA
jgi:hypothetical protein